MLTKKSSYFGLILVCAFVLVTGAFAVDVPTSLQGAVVVDAPRAKALLESGAAVFDVRVANEYAESHIKGATSIPYKEKSAKATSFNAAEDSWDISKLPVDKMASIVFYCNGPECWKSYKSSVLAIKAGYKKIYWFRNGIPQWKSSGFSVE